MARLIPSLVLACGALAAARTASAQAWIPVGPPGGDVRSLAADPRNPERIYLGTADGVFYRSDDGGLRWVRQAPGFPERGYSLEGAIDAQIAIYRRAVAAPPLRGATRRSLARTAARFAKHRVWSAARRVRRGWDTPSGVRHGHST